jgi:hypothetical protein
LERGAAFDPRKNEKKRIRREKIRNVEGLDGSAVTSSRLHTTPIPGKAPGVGEEGGGKGGEKAIKYFKFIFKVYATYR